MRQVRASLHRFVEAMGQAVTGRHREGLDLETSWLITASLCPNGGHLPVRDFNTHPDTRRQAFWRSDRQVISCEVCGVTLIRNGAYGANIKQNAWKIRRDCPCGRPCHEYADECEYMRRD